MSSGTKRPNEDQPHDRSSKPRDWRDAFLGDEEQPRRDRGKERDYRDKDRPRERDGRDHRRDEYRDRDRYDDRRSGMRRDRRENHDRDRDSHREKDYKRSDHRGGERDSRRGDVPRDRRYSDARDHYRNGGGKGNGPSMDREEGEIESPPKQSQPLHGSNHPSISPRVAESRFADGKAGFQSISIPTGPRGSNGQARQNPSSSAQPGPSRQSATAATEPASEAVVVLEEDRDPEKALEQRRRKREEIMAKFKANAGKPAASPAPSEPLNLGTGADSVTSGGSKTTERAGILTGTTTGATPLLKALGTKSSVFLTPNTSATTPNPHGPSLPATPLGKDFDLTKEAETTGNLVPTETQGGAAFSAADYDPTSDKKDDEQKRKQDAEVAEGVGEPVKKAEPVEDEWEEVEIEEDDEDEDLDMFAAFGDEDQPKKKRKVTVRRRKNAAAGEQEIVRPKKQSVLDVVDNVDDTDGYYRITPGEILDDGRYQVTISLGKGMFSGVVKAKVLKAVDQERRQDVVGKEVAIKVIRSQESMYVAGRKEAQILKKLNDADPEDKKHIVRMERQFEHRGHLCIVTESLSMNLRDVIKRFGKDVGLNMRAVRAYAHQMFLALSLMRKCSIVHADIKPDNILVSENKATLKVCDLGSAAEVAEGEITPYLVSRFYRAPEIILGLSYDMSIDIWSVACTLYELYTGKILFPGRSNNHMLLLMMEVKGKLSHRMIKKASLGEMHFDENMNFISIEKDKITGQDVLKTLVLSKATRDLRSRLLPSSSVQLKMKDDELKQLHNFIDLLEKCLSLDPAKRLTPREALLHPFLAGH